MRFVYNPLIQTNTPIVNRKVLSARIRGQFVKTGAVFIANPVRIKAP